MPRRSRKKIEYKIAAFDFETDPFKHDRIPKPFSWGFYNGEIYKDYWGDDCIEQFIYWLDTIEEPHVIYAHNGGKFDFLFLMKYFRGKLKIVNGRILEVEHGIHKFRDSYAILPVPLAASDEKIEIDYSKMERETREQHKAEILHYLKGDCVTLHKMVSLFIAEFGMRLTIGGTAMNELKQFHPYDPVRKGFDEAMRPFYFGGRCQAFEKGIIEDDIKVYDVNSMYPHAMRNFRHPFSDEFYEDDKITEETYFIEWEGVNNGAVPVRTKTGLDFNQREGVFHTSIHEWEAGLDTGTIEPRKIIRTINFVESTTFGAFIDHFFSKRDAAKKAGDLFHNIFYKLILNSSYGKFAQNPENYKEWCITEGGIYLEGYDGEGCEVQEHLDYILWGRPAEMFNYFNVAVAASITGAARSVLLRALAQAERPLYCDTDSIICRDLKNVPLDAYQLGAWDLEATGNKMAIAGKKLYALYDGDNCVKIASKGASLVPRDIGFLMPPEMEPLKAKKVAQQKAKNIGGEKILTVAKGGIYEFVNDAPSFKLNGNVQFIKRTIKGT
ncbi:DNA polymerase [Enterobacteria phage PRDvermilion]